MFFCFYLNLIAFVRKHPQRRVQIKVCSTLFLPLPLSPSRLLPSSSHRFHTGALLISFLSVSVSVSCSLCFFFSFLTLPPLLSCGFPFPLSPLSPFPFKLSLVVCIFNKRFFRELLPFHHLGHFSASSELFLYFLSLPFSSLSPPVPVF